MNDQSFDYRRNTRVWELEFEESEIEDDVGKQVEHLEQERVLVDCPEDYDEVVNIGIVK